MTVSCVYHLGFPQAGAGRGNDQNCEYQGKTRKRLPTRPTAKSNGMILSFFKITCKSVGLWHCCLMVRSIIIEKQHQGKKDISVCLLFSLHPWLLSISRVTRAPIRNAWMQSFTKNFPLWWSMAPGVSLSLLPGATAAYYSSCPLRMIDNYTENRKRWKRDYLKLQIKNARLRKPQLYDCLCSLPSTPFLAYVWWQSC